MASSGSQGNINLVLDTVRETKDICFSKQSSEEMFRVMIKKNYKLEGVKLCLIVRQAELFTVAMETLANIPEIEDEELIILVLKHSLVPELVHTSHYPIIIEYLLAKQDEDSVSHDHLNIEKVANQLKEKGFEAESGCLILQERSTHRLLHSFCSALGSLSKWFK